MQIHETKVASGWVLAPEGRLDGVTFSILETRITALIEAGETRFVIDCARLYYLSSSGVKVLLAAAKKLAAKNGRIVLAAAQAHVLEVIHIGGFDAILPQFETVAAALAD
ncbi:MAG TPA: STAS domain-containing protein [Verrucomicrobiae bacterium]|nr:STAS domain-containing protein [Verrucomicrobiae bacterium]